MTSRRILYGSSCPTTKSGQHVIEIDFTSGVGWCCQCAAEFSPDEVGGVKELLIIIEARDKQIVELKDLIWRLYQDRAATSAGEADDVEVWIEAERVGKPRRV